jgi:hypothetical protein
MNMLNIKYYSSSIPFQSQISHDLSCLAVPLYLPCFTHGWRGENLNFINRLAYLPETHFVKKYLLISSIRQI